MLTTTKKKKYLKYLGILTVSLWVAVAVLVGLQVHNVTTGKNLVSRKVYPPSEKPIVTQYPESVDVAIKDGGQVTLTVQAESPDGGYIKYQWFKRWPNNDPVALMLKGETKNTIVVPISQIGSQMYSVVIQNTHPDRLSSLLDKNPTATVSVYPPIYISQPNQNNQIEVGVDQPLTISVDASSTADMFFQWYMTNDPSNTTSNRLPIDGETKNSLVVPTKKEGVYYYYLTVHNGHRLSVDSNVTTVKVVGYAPIITSQPQNKLVSLGDEVELSVDATAESGNISYQWYKTNGEQASGGTVIPNTNSKTLKVPTDKEGTYWYYVLATNTLGESIWTATSSVARVDVVQEKMDNPIILKQPQGIQIYQNDTAKLSVDATGSGQLQYQWYYNAQGDSTDGGKALSGQNQRDLSLVAIDLQSYYYYVVVTNDTGAANSGSVVSDIVQIKVLEREDNNGSGDNGDNNGGGDNNNNGGSDNDNGDNEDGWYQDNGDNQITPTTSSGKNLPWAIMGVASLGLMSASVWLIVRKMG